MAYRLSYIFKKYFMKTSVILVGNGLVNKVKQSHSENHANTFTNHRLIYSAFFPYRKYDLLRAQLKYIGNVFPDNIFSS